jgi:HK97 gp10 family phage protein
VGDVTFRDNTDAAKKALARTIEKALTKCALIVEGSAKAMAPVALGALRDTISHKVDINPDGRSVAEVGSPLEYAIYQEFGTGEFAENGRGRKGGWAYKTPDGEWHFTYGSRPQKFLRPAFEQNGENIEKIIATELGATFK